MKGKLFRNTLVLIWLFVFGTSIYLYFFHHAFLQTELQTIFGKSVALGFSIFLIASCLRGFTLIPVTYYIVAGLLLFNPMPLYAMTMAGVAASSLSVYYFSEYMNFDEYFESKYPNQIKKIKRTLSRHEFPIVVGWSFAPFLPTDLICYVCGTLGVDIRTFIFGVLLGEGVSCAGYIFLGKQLLSLMKF